MPLYKVWNQHRSLKKCIVGNGLQDVIEKGKTKLGLQGNVKIVLEEDGTDVDDDDILKEFAGATLILLQDEEKWVPGSNVQSSPETTVDIQQDVEPLSNVKAVAVPETSATSQLKPVGTTKVNLTKGPRDMPLPVFSSFVHQNLKEGNAHAIWGKLISEAANFYHSIGSLDSTGDYQAIGMKLWTAYPCIGMEGTKPWSVFTSNLSQHIRHLRWRAKKKSSPSLSSSTSRTSMIPTKRPRLKETSDLLPEEEYETHMEELRKEWSKPAVNRSEGHIKALMRETFANRQKWIKTLPDTSIFPLFEKVPCYADGTYLLHDCQLLLGKEVFGGLTKSMKTFLKATESLMGMEQEGPSRMLPCVTFIENKTSFDKGKGKKSCPVITMKDDIADSDIETNLVTSRGVAPHIVLFRNDDIIKGSFIVGDSVIIDCQSNNVSVAVLMLLAAYYVFDLDYPRIYSQFLGILQTHFLKIMPYDGQKSKKYCVFSSQLRNEIKTIEKEGKNE